MSLQWHYTDKGQQRGPISAEELKSRAATGTLGPEDLVWKEGMAEWVPARKVEGLLVTPQAAVAPPPPLPTQVKADTAKLFDALKTTGRLAAKQAERTRLVTISLTDAYHRLGKSIVDSNVGRDIFAEQFSALDALKNQMTAPTPPAEPPPQPQGLAQQAKAMAKTAADATQRKVAKTRFGHALSSLGKSAYEKRNELSLSQQEIAAIESLVQQVAIIDAEIQQLSAQKPGQSLIDNRIVHALLAVCCFPIGLFLIWRSQQWSKRAKLVWTGAVAVLFIGGVLAPKEERLISKDVSDQSTSPPSSSAAPKKISKVAVAGAEADENKWRKATNWSGTSLRVGVFKQIVKKFKSTPDKYASERTRSKLNEELAKLIDEFEAIPFNGSYQSIDAREIINLWESNLEHKYQGHLYDRIQEDVAYIFEQYKARVN